MSRCLQGWPWECVAPAQLRSKHNPAMPNGLQTLRDLLTEAPDTQ
jgi:hypothetical protein